jgi:predicted DNA-binding transcriptional regulator AlpA
MKGQLVDLLAAIRTMPREWAPQVLGAAMARCMAIEPEPAHEAEPEDKLLGAPQVAERLGITVESVYRKRLPFRIEVSGRCTRYSQRGLEAWLRERNGKGSS